MVTIGAAVSWGILSAKKRSSHLIRPTRLACVAPILLFTIEAVYTVKFEQCSLMPVTEIITMAIMMLCSQICPVGAFPVAVLQVSDNSYVCKMTTTLPLSSTSSDMITNSPVLLRRAPDAIVSYWVQKQRLLSGEWHRG